MWHFFLLAKFSTPKKWKTFGQSARPVQFACPSGMSFHPRLSNVTTLAQLKKCCMLVGPQVKHCEWSPPFGAWSRYLRSPSWGWEELFSLTNYAQLNHFPFDRLCFKSFVFDYALEWSDCETLIQHYTYSKWVTFNFIWKLKLLFCIRDCQQVHTTSILF